MSAIRIVVVDDQAAVRDALAVMLAMDQDIDVLATASNGQEAVEIVERLVPDVVLMDLNMPVLDGVEATRRLRRILPDLAVVVLTTFEDDASILGALEAGALGYLTKDADRNRIIQAIRSAFAGQGVLDQDVQLRLLALAGRRSRVEPDLAVPLTAREREVLDLIGEGLRNVEIAERLHIGEATVKTHVNHLFSKADLASRADAVRLALTLAAGDAR
jgi:DNA-binding NarL/FixJ family response regulator